MTCFYVIIFDIMTIVVTDKI